MKKLNICFVILAILFLYSCKKPDLINPLDDVLQISSDKSYIKTGGDTAVITVVGYDTKSGKPLPDNTLVMFETTLGILSASSVKLMGGQGSVRLTSESKTGTAEIRASAQTLWASPNPLKIQIETVSVGELIMSASPSALPPGGGTSRIIVYARDAGGNPLNGVFVSLYTTAGFLYSGGGHITNSDGRVEDMLDTSETATITATTGTLTNNITVTVLQETGNEPPKAYFSYYPSNPQMGESVIFDASSSFDNDGHIVFYEWDFGDGSRFTGPARQVSHIYSWDDGDSQKTFTVILTVIDDDGDEDTSQGSVTVSAGSQNQEPTAEFTFSPVSPSVGQTVIFDGSSSSDPDGSIVSWKWEFGDGSTGSGKDVSHAYFAAGTYTIILTVTDNQGEEDKKIKTITVT